MANFNTHLGVALAVSSALAGASFMAGITTAWQTLSLTLLGAIGGLLPDIDLDNSRIGNAAFLVASLLLAIFITLVGVKRYALSWADALVAVGTTFFSIRFGVFALYSKLTVHRGMVHSIPYMAVFALGLVVVLSRMLSFSAMLSWLCGLFLFLGALVHLVLDELFSINVLGLKVKRSFGTAFKFFERKKALAYFGLYGLVALLWYLCPSITPVLQALPKAL